MPWKVLYLFQIFSILSLCFSGKQEKKQAREIIPFGPFEIKITQIFKKKGFSKHGRLTSFRYHIMFSSVRTFSFNKISTNNARSLQKLDCKEEFMSDFNVTDLAVSKLKEYMEQNSIDSALRVALMQGG
jgi:hypothetical protein